MLQFPIAETSGLRLRHGAPLVLALAVLAALVVPSPASAAPGDNLVVNPGLEATTGGVPDCFTQDPLGSAAAQTTYTLIADAHGGTTAQRIEVAGLEAGGESNRKLVVAKTPGCAPAVTPGSTYDFSLWYRADSTDLAGEISYRIGGVWQPGITYPLADATVAAWTLATFSTGAVPAGADAVSFGLKTSADGWVETDDYSLVLDEGAAPVEPPPPGTGPAVIDEVNIEGLNQPTAIDFLPGGQVAVAEKPGVIKIFDSLASTTPAHTYPFEDKVSSYGDFGLTALATVPVGAQTYLYANYLLDGSYTPQANDDWNDECPNLGNVGPTHPPEDAEGCPLTGRVVRFPVAADGSLGAEQVVLEGYDNFCFQYITHGVDALEYDPSDGTLLLSVGDGANYNVVDYGQYQYGPDNFQANGVTCPNGAFRSQNDESGSGGIYDGKILRLDPAAGTVLRVEARGLRNPFRLSLTENPAPGAPLYVTDTGWGAWEEVNELTPGGATENFGWPCYEGSRPQEEYQALDNPVCTALAGDPTLTAPLTEYAHIPQVFGGKASVTAVEQVDGHVYFGDATLRFIKAIDLADPDAAPVTVMEGDGVQPVDLRRTPSGGLVYVHIGEFDCCSIQPNTGSIEAVFAGGGGGGGGGVTGPEVNIAVRQGPYSPGEVVSFSAEATGFRVEVTYEWSATLTSCQPDGSDCTERELTAEELTTDGNTGEFIGPDEPFPASVELTVVANAVGGGSVTDTVTIARSEVGPDLPDGPVVRIAGAERIDTAVEVSRYTHETGTPVAYVARADDFPDALAAGPLAAATGGPILLTYPDTLAAATADELRRLDPERVVVLGGSAAISDATMAALEAEHETVERVAGATRYSTAAAITALLGPVDTVYVATGERFPDALVGGVAAGNAEGAILLTTSTDVPEATVDALSALQPEQIVLVGGEVAASAEVEATLADLGDTVRVFGATRYETALAVAQATHPDGVETAYFATGEAFPDALSIAPTAIRAEGALLLTPTAELLPGVGEEITRLAPSQAVLVGGEAALSSAVESSIGDLLAP